MVPRADGKHGGRESGEPCAGLRLPPSGSSTGPAPAIAHSQHSAPILAACVPHVEGATREAQYMDGDRGVSSQLSEGLSRNCPK